MHTNNYITKKKELTMTLKLIEIFIKKPIEIPISNLKDKNPSSLQKVASRDNKCLSIIDNSSNLKKNNKKSLTSVNISNLHRIHTIQNAQVIRFQIPIKEKVLLSMTNLKKDQHTNLGKKMNIHGQEYFFL